MSRRKKTVDPILGFKATDKYMKCRGLLYQLGQKQFVENPTQVEQCAWGFHFCKKFVDVLEYYRYSGIRLFTVAGSGYYHHGKDKTATSEIEFLTEMTTDQIIDGIIRDKKKPGDQYNVMSYITNNCELFTAEQLLRVIPHLTFYNIFNRYILHTVTSKEVMRHHHDMVLSQLVRLRSQNSVAYAIHLGSLDESIWIAKRYYVHSGNRIDGDRNNLPTSIQVDGEIRRPHLLSGGIIYRNQLIDYASSLGRVDELATYKDKFIKFMLIERGWCLDILAKDSNYLVRLAIVKAGYIIPSLLNDPNKKVRDAIQKRNQVK